MHEPDPATIRAAAAGDEAAFAELVRAYQAQVWRFLRHMLGDPQLAEDVAQETFIRVHRRLRQFRFRSKFSTWLYAVARNAGVDAIRARRRRAALAERAAPARAGVPGGELRVELDAALQSLPARLREAFLLIEVLGFRYREAGTVLGVPEGTVKSRVFYAREHLVAWLEAGEEAADEL